MASTAAVSGQESGRQPGSADGGRRHQRSAEPPGLAFRQDGERRHVRWSLRWIRRDAYAVQHRQRRPPPVLARGHPRHHPAEQHQRAGIQCDLACTVERVAARHLARHAQRRRPEVDFHSVSGSLLVGMAGPRRRGRRREPSRGATGRAGRRVRAPETETADWSGAVEPAAEKLKRWRDCRRWNGGIVGGRGAEEAGRRDRAGDPGRADKLTGRATVNDERMQILKMVQEGTITAEEAASCSRRWTTSTKDQAGPPAMARTAGFACA